MKKLLSALLCAALMLILPVQALAAEGDVLHTRGDGTLSEREGVYNCCALGDTFYMLADDAILAQKANESEPQRYALTLDVQEDDDHYATKYLLGDAERLLLLVEQTDYSGSVQVKSAQLYAVTLEGDQASLELLCEPDWDQLRYDDEGYYYYISSYLSLESGMLFTTYDEMGDALLMSMNYADGAISRIDVRNVRLMTAYLDGQALLETFDYNQPDRVEFLALDLADGSTELVAEMTIEDYETPSGLACDRETGALYCVKGGEIRQISLADGTLGEAIAVMPLEVYSDRNAWVLPGGWYACASYDGYALCSLHPAQKATKRLKIEDNTYDGNVSDAYYAFISANGDTNAILSHEYSADSLIDSMMNRDSDVDVYVVSTTSESFEAVFNRGFIAGLGDGPATSDLKQHLNSGLLERLSVNGEFAVLPVSGYFWLPRVNTVALEKLGLTLEDVPQNWLDFMDFLFDLQARMPEDGSVSLFDPYTCVSYARSELFSQIFSTYQSMLTQDAQAVRSDVMVEILEKLDRLDFAALGQPSDEEVEREDYNPRYDEDSILLNLNTGVGAGELVQENAVPLVMALAPDVPASMPLDGSVAFINPYSENIEGARAYMELLCERMSDSMRCILRDDCTEPVRNPYYEETMKSMEGYLDEIRQQLDEAEPADRQELEERLKYAQEDLERARNDVWMISAEDIAWLQAHVDQLVLQTPNWLYSEDNGEVYELVQQYCQGAIDARRLMKAIDGKVRMMLLEGN